MWVYYVWMDGWMYRMLWMYQKVDNCDLVDEYIWPIVEKLLPTVEQINTLIMKGNNSLYLLR